MFGRPGCSSAALFVVWSSRLWVDRRRRSDDDEDVRTVFIAFVYIWALVAWPTIAVAVPISVEVTHSEAPSSDVSGSDEACCGCCDTDGTPSDHRHPCEDNHRCPCTKVSFGSGVVMLLGERAWAPRAPSAGAPLSLSLNACWRPVSPLLRPPILSA